MNDFASVHAPTRYQYPVTVLMPVYNAEKYVAEAVRSILEQSFGQFEFLVINDGSTDTSRDIIESFKDPRIRIVDTANQGVAAALRRGLEEAQGGYIARMDADDVATRHRLEKEKSILDRNPDVVLVHGAIEYMDEEGGSLGVARSSDFDPVTTRWMLLWKNVPSHSTVMVRTDSLRKNGLNYRVEVNGAEDFDLWNRLALQGEFYFVRDVMLRYRSHQQSVMKAGKAEMLVDAQARVISESLARYGVNVSSGEARELAIISGGSPHDQRKWRYHYLRGRLHELHRSALQAFEAHHGVSSITLCRVQAGQLVNWARHMTATSRGYALRLLFRGFLRSGMMLLHEAFWKAVFTILLPGKIVRHMQDRSRSGSITGSA